MAQPHCFSGGCCWLTCLGIFLVWWLVAATLVWLTWNRVLVPLFKLKPAKLWQSFILIATIVVLMLPKCYLSSCKMRERGRCEFDRRHHSLPPSLEDDEPELEGRPPGGPKGDCPYMKHDG